MKTFYSDKLPFTRITVNHHKIDVVIDTGFDGALLLPLNLVQKLQLRKIGMVEYVVADGSISKGELFITQIEWFNGVREVTVMAAETEFSLIGMDILFHAKIMLWPVKDVLTIEDGS